MSVCNNYKKNVVVVFTSGTVIRYDALLRFVKYHLVLCQIWVIVANCSYILCICCDISKKGLIFIHIWYSNQVLGVVDIHVHKITFGCLPNLSNYGNSFLKFYICCDILEKNGLILFIFGSYPQNWGLDACKIYLGSVQKCSIYVHHFVRL